MRRTEISTSNSDDHPAYGVGWARKSRHYVEGKQVRQLQDSGCRVVYMASEAHIEDLIRALRPEDPEPVRVTTLARLAATRDDLRDAIDSIHAKGCWIEEISTGRTTRDDAATVAAMVIDAANELTKDARSPTKRQAQAMAKASHDARNANTAERRMPIAEARAIWHGHPTWSNEDCLAAMPGWTEGTAYRKLRPRGLAKGRPVLRKIKGKP